MPDKPSLLESSVDFSEVSGDVLRIRYVPLSAFDLDVQLWQRNSKKHDLQLLDESIEEYGYADCAKWDSNLNDGKGGFVYGNGRSQSLIFRLHLLQKEGKQPPRGVGKLRSTGEWVVPVKFGVDAKSEADANRFGISHNVINMSGGDFSAHDISRMFDESFLPQLQEMVDEGELPIAFDGDYLDALLRYEQVQEEEKGDRSRQTREIECVCPECGHEFIRQS